MPRSLRYCRKRNKKSLATQERYRKLRENTAAAATESLPALDSTSEQRRISDESEESDDSLTPAGKRRCDEPASCDHDQATLEEMPRMPPLRDYSRSAQTIEEDLPPLIVETVRDAKAAIPEDVAPGRRIIDIVHFNNQIEMLQKHTSKCTYGRMQLLKEVRSGLHSTLVYQCVACDVLLNVTTTPEENDVNDAAVWGALSVGIGRAQLEELLGVMEVPIMAASKFRKHEEKIGQSWKERLTVQMKEHGEEELRLANLAGDVIDGVPFITVIVDGGWAKRSYRHGYNAHSGIACIIGARTKKLLYLGVKNKYCLACAKSSDSGTAASPPDHVCFKNYTGTSTGMEQEIIVEGFCASIKDHGLMYRYMVGDGDSSVYARVRQHVPYGIHVEKIECANHVVRCYKDKLYSLCGNKLYNVDYRKLLRAQIDRICKGTRAAIRYCEGDAQRLKADIVNAPYHVLGKHTQCGSFCDRRDKGEHNYVPDIEKTKLWTEVKKMFMSLAAKAELLKDNWTTNQAERLMGCVAKFSGGKRVNFTSGGGYQHRSMGAGLAHSSGMTWHVSSWKGMTKKSPGRIFKSMVHRRTATLTARRLRFEAKGPHRRRRGASGTAEADFDYGPDAAEPDVSFEKLLTLKEEWLSKLSGKVPSMDESTALERATVGQRQNQLWRDARKPLLTASNFGKIMNRRSCTPCHNQVKDMIYSIPKFSRPIQYGIDNEAIAIQKYEEVKGVVVEEAGLFVVPEFPFLGASPDGLIGTDGLVEVKCLYAIGNQSPMEGAKAKHSSMCVDYEAKADKLVIKPGHNHHYQIQGQLELANREHCDLVLHSEGGTNVLRINRDRKMWREKMLPKLRQFYMECMLPEFADPRVRRGMKIREPDFISCIINKKAAEKKQPAKKSAKKSSGLAHFISESEEEPLAGELDEDLQ